MKLGICTYPYLYSKTVEEAIEAIGQQGYKYAELMTISPHIWVRDLDSSARHKLRTLFDKNNIELMAVNPTYLDLNLVSMNPGFRAESIRQIQETFQFGGDLGAKMQVIMLGKRHSLIPAPYETTWEMAKDAIYQCLEYADKANMIFALENATSNFMTTAKEAKKMGDEINHPNFKIVYDVANGYMSEDPNEGLLEVLPYLAYVHISDTTKQKWGHQAIGDGSVDFDSIAKTLKKIDYQGVTIFELTDPSDPDALYQLSYEKLAQLGWSK